MTSLISDRKLEGTDLRDSACLAPREPAEGTMVDNKGIVAGAVAESKKTRRIAAAPDSDLPNAAVGLRASAHIPRLPGPLAGPVETYQGTAEGTADYRRGWSSPFGLQIAISVVTGTQARKSRVRKETFADPVPDRTVARMAGSLVMRPPSLPC